MEESISSPKSSLSSYSINATEEITTIKEKINSELESKGLEKIDSISNHVISVCNALNLSDSSEVLIGKMKKDDSKKTDFVLENSNGEKILQCKSFPSENYFDLYDDADKLVAKIKIHSHKSFTKEIYDVPQSWTLQIQESSFEKLLLLGFCLSLYHFHIATGGGPGV